jgi:ankyrin repeat protein
MKATDLHGYAVANRAAELKEAIQTGRNINEQDRFGATPLHSAIAYKNREAIHVLLDHGADVTIQDNDGSTPLHYAIEHGLLDVAEALVKVNAQVVAIADKSGNQPLWTAAFNSKGNYAFVSLLLRFRADPRHRNNGGLTPIDVAKRKRDDVLNEMLEAAQ